MMKLSNWLSRYPRVAQLQQQEGDALEGVSTEEPQPACMIPMPQRYWNYLHDVLFEQLHCYPRAQLLIWFVDFNCHQWPGDFPLAQPYGWETMSGKGKYVIVSPIFNVLTELTTAEDRSRTWWTRRLHKTVAEWQAWWEERKRHQEEGNA